MNLPFSLHYNIRQSMPEKLKRVLRGVALAFFDHPRRSTTVPQHLLEDCKLLTSRVYMLDFLPKEAVVCEVGVLKGDFSRKILSQCSPKEFHLVDVNFKALQADVSQHENVVMHKGFSYEVLQKFPDGYFDWIYIDADHTYEGVKADIQVAQTKVKPGGYLVFNDFALIARMGLGTFGVHNAVCEFASEKGWPFAYFCMNGQALYDVALRRPPQ
jgi:hypothetical protein